MAYFMEPQMIHDTLKASWKAVADEILPCLSPLCPQIQLHAVSARPTSPWPSIKPQDAACTGSTCTHACKGNKAARALCL